jgi:uncharacterized repeat protein (TIGR03943 family)
MSRPDGLRLARAALLIGFGLVIAKLLLAGQMHYYLSPGLDWLSVITAVLLASMGALELRNALRANDPVGRVPTDLVVTLGVLAVPVLFSLTYSPHSLTSGALGGTPAAQLVLAFDAAPPSSAAVPPPAPRRPIEDVGDLLSYLRQAGQAGVGQRVHLRGLVAHDDDLGGDQFVLLRYSIVHCVADAQPLGFLVLDAPPNGGWQSDQWVEIDGTLATQSRSGDQLVAIHAQQIVSSEEPLEPYVSAL